MKSKSTKILSCLLAAVMLLSIGMLNWSALVPEASAADENVATASLSAGSYYIRVTMDVTNRGTSDNSHNNNKVILHYKKQNGSTADETINNFNGKKENGVQKTTTISGVPYAFTVNVWNGTGETGWYLTKVELANNSSFSNAVVLWSGRFGGEITAYVNTSASGILTFPNTVSKGMDSDHYTTGSGIFFVDWGSKVSSYNHRTDSYYSGTASNYYPRINSVTLSGGSTSLNAPEYGNASATKKSSNFAATPYDQFGVAWGESTTYTWTQSPKNFARSGIVANSGKNTAYVYAQQPTTTTTAGVNTVKVSAKSGSYTASSSKNIQINPTYRVNYDVKTNAQSNCSFDHETYQYGTIVNTSTSSTSVSYAIPSDRTPIRTDIDGNVWEFYGWSTASGTTNNRSAAGSSITIDNYNDTIYATYRRQLKIEYYFLRASGIISDGATETNKTSYIYNKATYGSVDNYSAVPATGKWKNVTYNFSCWTDNANEINESDFISSAGSNTVTTAQKCKREFYGIYTKKIATNFFCFDASGNRINLAADDTTKYSTTETINVGMLNNEGYNLPVATITAPDADDFTYNGHTFEFVGWSKMPNSSAVALEAGGTEQYALTDTVYNYYAVYSVDAEADYVYFDDDGEAVHTETVTSNKLYYTTGRDKITTVTPQSVTLTPPVDIGDEILYNNITFKLCGWTTDPASNTEMETANTFDPVISAKPTYYAVYKRDVTANFNYYDAEGNKAADGATVTKTRKITADNPSNNTDGFEFTFPAAGNTVSDDRDFEFLGWRDSAEAAAPNVIPGAGSKINLSLDSEVYNYYAVYDAYLEADYNVNGGTLVDGSPAVIPNTRSDEAQYLVASGRNADAGEKSYLNITIADTILKREGSDEFLGWRLFDGNTESETPDYEPGETISVNNNAHLIAVYSDRKFKVEFLDYAGNPIEDTQYVRYNYSYTADANTNGAKDPADAYGIPEDGNVAVGYHYNKEYHYVYDEITVHGDTTLTTVEHIDNKLYIRNVKSDITITTTYRAQHHTWVQDYVLVKPICNNPGYAHRHCSVCGYGSTDKPNEMTIEEMLEADTAFEIIDESSHEYRIFDQKAATCTVKGRAGRALCVKCFNYVQCPNEECTARDVAIADLVRNDDGELVCPTCGAVINPITSSGNPTNNHVFDIEVGPSADGGVIFKCHYCERTITKYGTEAGKTLSAEPAKRATCIEEGYDGYYVDEDGNMYSDINGMHLITELVKKPKTPHNFREPLAEAVEATCTAPGYAAGAAVCSLCGYTISYADYLASLTDLTYEAFVEQYNENLPQKKWNEYCEALGEDEEPLSLEEYKTAFADEIAAEEYKVDYIPSKGGHQFVAGSYVAYKAPTCAQDGNSAYAICEVCGKLIKLSEQTFENDDGTQTTAVIGYTILNGEADTVIKCKGHKFAAGEEYHAATCTEPAYAIRQCLREGCEAEDPDHIVIERGPALGHNLVLVEYKAPTCTDDGNKAYYACSRCDYKVWDNDPELADDEDNIIADIAETVIEKNGHHPEFVEGKAAKCNEEGYVEHYHCEDCGRNFEDAEATVEIPDITLAKTAHTYENEGAIVKTKGPDCKTKGDEILTCDVCGDVKVNRGKGAYGDQHQFEPYNQAATCGDDGFTGEKCKLCGETRNMQTIPATGDHRYGEWVVDGNTRTKTCSVCGDVVTENIDDPTPEEPTPSGYTKCPKCGFVHEGRTGIFVQDGLYCKVIGFFRSIFGMLSGK